jgi:predicted NAD-dependent protein-ADP-ribosyltransferase YbiA (DUF1768 family)
MTESNLSNSYRCIIKLDNNEWLSVDDYVEACKYRNRDLKMFKTYTAPYKLSLEYYKNMIREENKYLRSIIDNYAITYNLNEKQLKEKIIENNITDKALIEFRRNKRNKIAQIQNKKEKEIAIMGFNHIEFIPSSENKKNKTISNYVKIKKSSLIISLFAKFCQNKELNEALLNTGNSVIYVNSKPFYELMDVRECIKLYSFYDLKHISNFSTEVINKIFDNKIKNKKINT